MRYILKLIILCVVMPSHAAEVKLPIGSTLQNISDGKTETLLEEKSVIVNQQSPLLVQIPKGIPLLIYVPAASNSVINLNEIDLKPMLNKIIVGEMNLVMNEITRVHLEVQNLLQKKNLPQALERAKALQTKYADLALGYFLEGSTQYLMGNKDLAIKALEKGLSLDPLDENAKKLLTNLRGGVR